jgi:hypothetical protein
MDNTLIYIIKYTNPYIFWRIKMGSSFHQVSPLLLVFLIILGISSYILMVLSFLTFLFSFGNGQGFIISSAIIHVTLVLVPGIVASLLIKN